jgi:beta-1,4-mannosyl-glycoprotein beta-1,4-N-acetylglucosaminyltransferase
VDYFVIGQSEQTFSGKDKELYFDLRDKRWEKWKDKIIVVTIPRFEFIDSFDMAAKQKDYLRIALFKCKPEDTIYYGDVDEIWTPQTEEGKLSQLNYSYYLNNRSSEEWQGTNVFKYKNIKNLNEIRVDHSKILPNGGWHFTNMGGADQIRKKLEAYDHQEFNIENIKQSIEEKIKNGEDYVGRKVDWQGKPFTMWKSEVDLPQYLKDNKNIWIKLFL